METIAEIQNTKHTSKTAANSMGVPQESVMDPFCLTFI